MLIEEVSKQERGSVMFKKIKEKFNTDESSDVLKGMFTLLIGASLARIVGVISIPILSRIYSPEDFGVLALYTAFVSILVPVMTLRYVQAIPLPKSDVMAFNLFSVCLKLILFFSIIIAIALLLFGEVILKWFNMDALITWRWLILPGVIGTALYELFSLWGTRKRQYKIIAKTQFLQSIIGNAVKIGLGCLGFKPGGIIVGQFISQSAGVSVFFKESKELFKKNFPKVKRNRQSFIAKFYQNYVWFRLPSEFLMVIGLQAPVLIAAKLYDSTVTGQLSFSILAISLPVSLLGAAISKAYYSEVAKIGRKNPKKIQQLTFDIQKKLFVVALPTCIVIYLISEKVFVLMFGQEWLLAGRYASILAPYVLLRFTSSPLDQVFNVIGGQIVYLIINLSRIISFVLVFWICFKFNVDDVIFVYIISWTMTGHYLFVTFLVMILVELEARKKL